MKDTNNFWWKNKAHFSARLRLYLFLFVYQK